MSTSIAPLFRPPARHSCYIDEAEQHAAGPLSVQVPDRSASLHGALGSSRANLHEESWVSLPPTAVSDATPAPAGVLAVHFRALGTEAGQ